MNSPEQLARAIRDFLAESGPAVVFEDGVELFDFRTARCSLSTEHNKCVLHIWSAERNAVRRVVDAEQKNGTLRLHVLRFGQAKPGKLEICRERDWRSPSQRRLARNGYRQRLRALLEHQFSEFTLEQLSCEMDLERSFSGVYTRGLLRQGRSAFAVLGLGAGESQGAIDGAITIGILWLDYCRERQAPRCHVEGLKLIVPRGTSAIVAERMAHLNDAAAKWQLYEWDEREGTFAEIEASDRGNIETRLAHCPDPAMARERFAASIRRVTEVLPDAEVAVLSGTEVTFRLHGLEVARARLEPEAGSFRLAEQVVFGAGPHETALSDETAEQFKRLLRRAAEVRHAQGPREHALWRMCPERWLESIVVRSIGAVDERLDAAYVYSQVPAFAAADRGVIDVLAATRDGRLAIIELKADEDIHLPLQGIDYWARVEWHRARGEFARYGYFPRLTLAAEPPILLLVAPALRVHPTTDALLRYLDPKIDVTLVGVDERWREELRVVFRKRRAGAAAKFGF